MIGRPFLWVLLLSVLWSASWPLIKFAGQSVPPVLLVVGRMTIAVACLVPYLYFTGSRLPLMGRGTGRIWGPLLLIALIGNALPYTLTAWGQHYVPSGLSAVLVGTMPVWTVLITHFFSSGERAGERLNAMKLVGALLGFAGIVLLVGPAALEHENDALFGELLLLAAALCWACGTIYTSFARVATPDQAAAATALLSALVLMPVSVSWEQPWTLEIPTSAMAAVLALGVIATALGTMLVFRITTRHGPTMMSMVMYLNPALAIVWGAVFFGESLAPRHVVAFACIVAGLVLIDRGRRRALAGLNPVVAMAATAEPPKAPPPAAARPQRHLMLSGAPHE